MSNNAPEVTLGITREQAEFLQENCEANIRLGLELLQVTDDRASAERLVQMNENFKAILDATKKGLTDEL